MENEKTKKKMGRPTKESTGKHFWVPAECVEKVQKIIDGYKKAKS